MLEQPSRQPPSTQPGTSLTVADDPPDDLKVESGYLVGRAEAFIGASRAPNTVRGYESDWRHFVGWSARHHAPSLPADPRLVALYLTSLAEGRREGGIWTEPPRRVTTLDRRLSAIRHYHRAAGHELDTRDPILRDTWRGIRRTLGVAPRGKAPTVTEFLRAMADTLPASPAGVRDRALLLVGFAGAFRRSELVAIDHAHCARHRDGIIITIPFSKTDQEGHADEVGLPYGAHPETCPVRALTDWLALADISDGPVFRPITRYGHIAPTRLTDRGVALVIKRAVSAARDAAIARGNTALAESLDPARYAGHSLRAGFITSAAAAGVSESDIMRQSRHKRSDTLRKYIRHATVFRQNAAAKVGL
jgi:integrase